MNLRYAAGVSAGVLAFVMITGFGFAEPKTVVTERVVEGGRAVYFEIGRPMLDVKIAEAGEPQRGQGTGGAVIIGEAIGNSLANKMRNDMIKVVQEKALPVQQAIADYPFAQRTQESLEAMLQRIAWLGAASAQPAQAAPPLSLLGQAEKDGKREVLYVTYAYALSRDFYAIEIDSTVRLARFAKEKTGSAPEVEDLFVQSFRSSFPLSDSKVNANVNGPLWAENGGARARVALDQGLVELHKMIERALALSLEEEKALRASLGKERRSGKALLGGLAKAALGPQLTNSQKVDGVEVEKSATGAVMFNKSGWVFVASPL